MADVFISYAREDRESAERLAKAFAARGWSVWWDREILAGRHFDEAIERELALARCVVVLWSMHSIGSEWVKNEAADGAERDVLVPASLDRLRPPLEFRRRQSADLTGWTGDDEHMGFEGLCDAVAATVGTDAKARETTAAALAAARLAARSRRRVIAGSSAALALAAIAGGGGWAWSRWLRTPDIAGRWDFEPQAKQYKTYVVFRFDNGRLTGTEIIEYEYGYDREAVILDGHAAGDRIRFRTVRSIDDQSGTGKTHQYVRRFEGRVDGDVMHLGLQVENGEYREIVARRRPTPEPAEKVGRLTGHSGFTNRLLLLADGRLASASRDKTVRVWDVEAQRTVLTIPQPEQVETIVPLGSDSLLVVTMSEPASVRSLRSGAETQRWQPIEGSVEDAIAINAARIAVSGHGGGIAICNAETGRVERQLGTDGRIVTRLALLPDGRLVGGDQDGTVRIWHLDGAPPEPALRQGEQGDVRSVTDLLVLKDGRIASCNVGNPKVSLFRASTGAAGTSLSSGPYWEPRALAQLADGRLAVLDGDSEVSLWNLSTGRKDLSFEVSDGRVAAGTILPLMEGRLAIGLANGTIDIWKLSGRLP